MNKIALAITLILFFWHNTMISQTKNTQQIQVNIDLNTIENDKVLVTIIPPTFTSDEITYHLPKIIPGTYSEDDYGKYIENLKAYNAKGESIIVTKYDYNSWGIKNAKNISKITYFVNDTFDIEDTHEIFSPAGTNIEAGQNILLNTHGFIGYFNSLKDITYRITVSHPESLWGATSMNDLDNSTTNDIFITNRYTELIENPIMYSKPDYTTFNINGMEILIAVYSPNGIHTAESISVDMKTMMIAQKNFLGKFNATEKYSVLLYLSDVKKNNDARGFGALEHPSVTTVVMPEDMPKEQLAEQLKDIVSHEFFHIVTPLSIHSKEIHDFDYNNPKMSEHLWLYEGVTEYFANLFQVNQGLITEDEFYNRMAGKISNASEMDDTMSFTKMSTNVLVKPYKDQYINVYEKGALIGMCLDILIREKSNGERGVLDLMRKLSNEYGAEKPFNDDELFSKITELTYPEIGHFLTTHVSGSMPINYDLFFSKVGVTKQIQKDFGNPFLIDKMPCITVNPETKEILILQNIPLNNFLNTLNIKGGDIIVAINDTNYNADKIFELLIKSENWKENDLISVKIKRNHKEQILKGKIKLPFEDKEVYQATNPKKKKLKEAWLNG